MMDPEWDDALRPRTLTRPAPLLADDELISALARLDDVGGLVGHIPAEVTR